MSTIDIWVPDLTFPGWMDRWHAFGDAFTALHPDRPVRVHGKDFWTFPAEVARAAAEGRAPALAEMYFYLGQACRDLRHPDGSPLFTSVEAAVDGRAEILGEPVVLDDLVPALREYYTLDGDLTSMPSVGTTSLIYANTDLMERAGLTAVPRTWAEVRAACEQVAGSAGAPPHGITWSNHGTFFQQAVALQGGELVDRANGRAGRATRSTLASKEMLHWAEWWRGLHRDGLYRYTGAIPDWAGTLGAFADQDVVFRISSSNDVNYMVRAAQDNGFGIAVAPFPTDDTRPYAGNAVAGTSIWLTSGLDPETRDGALAFLQWLHNPRNAADRHKANSFAPVTRTSFALLEEEGWFAEHPYHRVTSDHLDTYPEATVPADPAAATPPSLGAVFGDFAGNQDVMTRAMGDVLTGDVDPAERFAEADREAQGLLDDYNAWAAAGADPATAPGATLDVEHFTELRAGRDYSAADLEKAVSRRR
ncbi:MAG: extracellular solute-binding protein [Pseudonocardiales bacterium]|nr:extracellular solute-binding protein [Pseudonocardiales bacterium]